MNTNLPQVFPKIKLRRGLLFGVLIIAALLAFEMFNYSTTDYALRDLLGNLRFLGIPWATILAIAFCGIDFAGIARLFTPEQGADEPAEVWYLFGAWLLAATMNAMLTWWGVGIAIMNHNTAGNALVSGETLLKVVPVFVALMVWLIRILIIGTFSVAGERLFSQGDRRSRSRSSVVQNALNRTSNGIRPLVPSTTASFRPAPKGLSQSGQGPNRPEPTYRPISMSGSSPNHSSQRHH